MPGLNRTTLLGYLCHDPEPGKLPNGIVMSKFRMAVNEKRGEKERVSYFKIKIFGKTAAICNAYLFKGCLVYVEGRLITKKYQHKNPDGTINLDVWNHTYEIYADFIQKLTKGNGDGRPPIDNKGNYIEG